MTSNENRVRDVTQVRVKKSSSEEQIDGKYLSQRQETSDASQKKRNHYTTV